MELFVQRCQETHSSSWHLITTLEGRVFRIYRMLKRRRSVETETAYSCLLVGKTKVEILQCWEQYNMNVTVLSTACFWSTGGNLSSVSDSLAEYKTQVIAPLLSPSTFCAFLGLLRLVSCLLFSSLLARRRHCNETLDTKCEESHDFGSKCTLRCLKTSWLPFQDWLHCAVLIPSFLAYQAQAGATFQGYGQGHSQPPDKKGLTLSDNLLKIEWEWEKKPS